MFKLKPSLDWLLLFIPAAMVLRWASGAHHDTALFVCSCLAIIPLAKWMGHATEALARHLGEGLGGLLNATFGNAAELIIALIALSRGLTGVVKASITGSIIGNVLLVLGLSLVAGGAKYQTQRFNQTAARSSVSSLTLAAIALTIPSVFHFTASHYPDGWQPELAQRLSLAIAVVLFLTYGCTLAFSLKTHKQFFIGGDGEETSGENGVHWTRGKATAVLAVATIFVALMSEFLVGTVEAARARLGFTEVFVGIIVVAIIGNAAEHSTAVMMARKNKMDLSLGIAIGSSLQIALFVSPLLVFTSYLFGRPMNLEFTPPEVIAVGVSVLLVSQISGDGESNWLEGVQLLSVYFILGILFYYLPPPHP